MSKNKDSETRIEEINTQRRRQETVDEERMQLDDRRSRLKQVNNEKARIPEVCIAA